MTRRALVFGSTGALGHAIAETLERDGHAVCRASRSKDAALAAHGPFDAVVWAQGTNVNDSAGRVDLAKYEEVMAGNVGFVVSTLNDLVSQKLLTKPAALCVLGSIWQEHARAGKFSYTISKAAIGGLVRAAALDLAPSDVRINAVLPGVVDTPMTNAMLTPEQKRRVDQATPLGRLVTPEEIANLVAMVVGPATSGVTGQSFVIDGGFSIAKAI